MTKRARIAALAAAAFFIAVLGFCILVFTVDVKPIGPTNPDEPHMHYSVGLASMNGAFRDAIKTSAFCYTTFFILTILAAVLAVVPVALFVWQMIQVKDFRKVNFSIFLTAAFYVTVYFLHMGVSGLGLCRGAVFAATRISPFLMIPCKRYAEGFRPQRQEE